MAGFLGGMAGGATVSIVIRAVDEFSKTFDDAKTKTENIGRSTLAMNTNLLLAAGGLATITAGALNFASAAAVAGDIQTAFNKVVGNDKVWKTMQKNVLGTVDKYQLMTVATRAISSGVREDLLPTMSKLAMKLKDMNPAYGEVTDIMNSMTMALVRGNDRLLMQYGINVDLKKATDEYALSLGIKTSELDESQKIIVAQIAIEEALKIKNNELADSTEDAADKIDQLKTKLTETKIEIGQALEPSVIKLLETFNNDLLPTLITLTKTVLPMFIWTIGRIGDAIKIVEFTIVEWKDMFYALAIASNQIGIGMIKAFSGVVNFFIDGINKVINAYMSLPKALRVFGTIKTIGKFAMDTSEYEKAITDFTKKREENMARLSDINKQTEEIVQETITKPLSKEEEMVKQLENYKVLYSKNYETGKWEYGDLYNTKAFASSEFQSNKAYEQANLGAGVTINIDNVNGIDPTEIAEALEKMIRNKIIS